MMVVVRVMAMAMTMTMTMTMMMMIIYTSARFTLVYIYCIYLVKFINFRMYKLNFKISPVYVFSTFTPLCQTCIRTLFRYIEYRWMCFCSVQLTTQGCYLRLRQFVSGDSCDQRVKLNDRCVKPTLFKTLLTHALCPCISCKK